MTIFTFKKSSTFILRLQQGMNKIVFFCPFPFSFNIWESSSCSLKNKSNRLYFLMHTKFNPFIVLILEGIGNFRIFYVMKHFNSHMLFILTFFPFQVPSCFIVNQNNVLRTFCPQ